MATITLKKTKLSKKMTLVEKEYEFVPELWEMIKDYMLFKIPIKEGEYVIEYQPGAHWGRDAFVLFRRVPQEDTWIMFRPDCTSFYQIQMADEVKEGNIWWPNGVRIEDRWVENEEIVFEDGTRYTPNHTPMSHQYGWEKINGAWRPQRNSRRTYFDSAKKAIQDDKADIRFFKTDVTILTEELIKSLLSLKVPK